MTTQMTPDALDEYARDYYLSDDIDDIDAVIRNAVTSWLAGDVDAVADLLEDGAMVEIEATAVIPD
mgnify:CR=1 FL=1